MAENSIVDICLTQFFASVKKKAGRLLDGVEWNEMPKNSTKGRT